MQVSAFYVRLLYVYMCTSITVVVALLLVEQAASSIHDGVTRFTLVYKANPGEAASASMANEMGGFCQQMVSSLT